MSKFGLIFGLVVGRAATGLGRALLPRRAQKSRAGSVGRDAHDTVGDVARDEPRSDASCVWVSCTGSADRAALLSL